MNDLSKKVGKTPCYKCEDRTSECHSTCEKYIEWKHQYEIERQDRQNLIAKEKYDPRSQNFSAARHNRIISRKRK